jgi:hypothetical protein
MLSLASASTSVCKQFVDGKALVLLHFLMQKYAVQDDNTSESLCVLVSKVIFWMIDQFGASSL